MTFAELEQKVDDFFKKLAGNASPSATATINAARSLVSLALNVGREALRSVIESGQYRPTVEIVRGVALSGVRAVLPASVRWIPFIRPGRAVNQLFDWLIEQEADLAVSVGARIPA